MCIAPFSMRPLLYSENLAASHRCGWRRCASEVCYFANQYSYIPYSKKRGARSGSRTGSGGQEESSRPHHTLTMVIIFPAEDDVCYVAQCYPYTYSMLQASLGQIVSRCRKAEVVRRERLCYTAGGLCATTTRRGGVDTSRCEQAGGIACDLISVSDFSSPPEEVAARRVVVISARGTAETGDEPHASMGRDAS